MGSGRQHRGIANVACRDLDGADLQRFLVHSQMELAPKALLAPAVLAGIPLPFTLSLNPSRVDQQMQRTGSATVGNGDVQGLLAAAKGAEVRDLPVEACQPQQALDETGRLTKRHTKQHLHRKANLYSRIAELTLTPALAGRRGIPFHLGIKPDR